MKICVRAARERSTFGDNWLWLTWLEPSHPSRDRHGYMVPGPDAIHVGWEYATWEEALKAGKTALDFANMEWTTDSHGVLTTVHVRSSNA